MQSLRIFDRRLVTALLTAAVVVPSALGAQEPRILVGLTLTRSDSMPLVGVHVSVLGRPETAQTAATGRFRLVGLPQATVGLVFQRVGVMADTVEVAPGRGEITVYLLAAAVQVAPLVATAQRPARQRFEREARTSTVSLDAADLEAPPSLAEPDLVRVVQLLPGTVAKNDFTTALNVRGGESDQNLILLDGMPVFNPFHVGGMFSTFEPAAVAQVDFLTGGVPVEYSGRLSSVLDVRLRPGRDDRLGVTGSISVIAAKLMLEGPIPGTDMTFLVSGRRSYADAVVAAATEEDFRFWFADLTAKLSLQLPGSGGLSATGYWGRDVLGLPFASAQPGQDGIDLEFGWGNRVLALKWWQPFGSGVEVTTDLGVSDFNTGLGLVPDILRADNTVRLYTANVRLLLATSDRNEVRTGVGVESYAMTYDVESQALDQNLFSAAYRPLVWSAYLDDQWRPVDRVLIRPGVRVEHVGRGADITVVSPRISAKVFLNDDLALIGSAGRYYQAIHSIRDQDIPITLFDFWIGADPVTPVARSDQAVLGFEKWFGDNISLTVEGYSKSFDGLLVPDPADDPKVHGDEFTLTKGYSRGADVLLRKYGGRVSGWVAYGLAKTLRRASFGAFAPSHDRTHTLDVVVQMDGPLGSRMSVHWGYGSPLPYTGIVGTWPHREYVVSTNSFEDFNQESLSTTINGERYPNYHRLDASFRWDFRKWGVRWRPFVQVLNMYDRRNVFLYTFNFEGSPPTRAGLSQLPVTPTFGVVFEW